MSDDRRLALSARIKVRSDNEGVCVVYDRELSDINFLNATAGLVLTGARDGQSVAEIKRRLAARFPQAPQQAIAADVDAILERFFREGYIRIEPASPPTPPPRTGGRPTNGVLP